MTVATFDTLKFANTLKAAGVPDKQAEAQAVAFGEAFQVNLRDLTTKDDLVVVRADLSAVRTGLKHEIDDLRKDVKQEITEVKHEMKEMEHRLKARIDASDARNRSEQILLRWMIGATFTASLGSLSLLFRLLLLPPR